MSDAFLLPRYAEIHRAGEHCGSTAMLNLLRYHSGAELAEESVFGLSGAIWFCLISPPLVPVHLAIGRTISLETGICKALSLPYRERPATDDEAWPAVREALRTGTPVVIMGDSSELDYFGGPPFPGHRFLLVGYDEGRGVAIVGDRKWPALQEVSFESLARSRSQPDRALSAHNLWGIPTEPWPEAAELAERVRAAVRPAVCQAAELMLDPAADAAGVAGIATMARLASEIGEPELAALCRTNAFSIERAGNAGGFFRRMYAAFLRQQAEHLGAAGEPLAASFDELAAAWTAVAATMADAAHDGEPDRRRAEIRGALEKLAAGERAIWSRALEECG